MMRVLTAFAAALLLASCAFAMEKIRVCENQNKCLEFSKLIIGTDHLGKIGRDKMFEVLDEAARLGINTLDTAPVYIDSGKGTLIAVSLIDLVFLLAFQS